MTNVDLHNAVTKMVDLYDAMLRVAQMKVAVAARGGGDFNELRNFIDECMPLVGEISRLDKATREFLTFTTMLLELQRIVGVSDTIHGTQLQGKGN